jgi:hypothetical protein
MPVLMPGETAFEVCPQVAGRYADTGTGGNGTGLGPVSLTTLLYSDSPRTPAGTADVVVVRGPERDILQIESFAKGSAIAAFERRRLSTEHAAQVRHKGYICEKGFVRIRDHAEYGSLSPAPAAVFSSEGMWLRKAIDGSLIMLHVKHSSGLVLVIPYANAETVWYRFPPTAEPEGAGPGRSLNDKAEGAARP